MVSAAQQNGRSGDEMSFECTLDALLRSDVTVAASKPAVATIALNGQTAVTTGPLPMGRYKIYAVSGDNTFSIMIAKGPVTLVAGASVGQTLPQGVVNVVSTAGFPATGSFYAGATTQSVAYTGVTATSFTGCTGGTAAMTGTTQIWSASPTITAPTAGAPALTGLVSMRGDEIERLYIDGITTGVNASDVIATVGTLQAVWLVADASGKTGLVYLTQLTNDT